MYLFLCPAQDPLCPVCVPCIPASESVPQGHCFCLRLPPFLSFLSVSVCVHPSVSVSVSVAGCRAGALTAGAT